MGIGWDKIGDLSKLGDRNDIKEVLKEKIQVHKQSHESHISKS